MDTLRILLVDDHTLFRQGVASILRQAGERFEIVGEAGDGAQAQARALELEPDIILMDLQMPHCGGLQAARALAPKLPRTKIVMLTVSESDQDLFESLKAGARGYLVKTTVSAQEILAALESVAADQVILTPAMASKMVSEFAALARARASAPPTRTSESPDESHLTEREREVLELVMLGKTNKEIAAQLCVAENTVRAHLRNILDKLHAHNRTEAAMMLRKH